ncbi:MAG: tRNA (adenosine(37)-N6)-threonylcarbamoyltransferase complex dimerization subunit type 1 TsaB [Caldilineaceae bacterium]|nr:tRNA (adenosine(37)-N6)-threonylcarbamoyltransferase complex dimerization subunit type 1 TsaB [Caldilineaceae bacterium]
MLLALDVASSICTVVLFDPASDSVLAERVWRTRRRQTEETLPAVSRMMEQAGVDIDAIDAVAVTTGPGSFTGVRIGISAVKGIMLGLPQPPRVVGLPVLSVTAARFAPLAAGAGAAVWPVLQAGRGRFNWAPAPLDDPLWLPPVSEHRAGQADELAAALRTENRPVWLAGELTDDLRQAVQGLHRVRCIDPSPDFDLPADGRGSALTAQFGSMESRGESLARLALRHLRAGSTALTTPLQPLYLLPPR